ncbi:MAG: hypothetical protein LBJ71_02365, partial [Holosporaceae bacterium]|nr:hypothetical protein [Holosporaceae bacterium]
MIAVLYYLHDIPRLKRTQTQMNFCAHCAVNMIQNISQKRENKKIILQDFKYIFGPALIPHFGGGIDQYRVGEVSLYKRGYLMDWMLAYLKGMSNGQVKVLWIVFNSHMSYPGNMTITVRNDTEIRPYLPAGGQIVDANQILNGLSIDEGDYKAIFAFAPATSSGVILPNGKNALTTSWREKFRFLLFTPDTLNGRGTYSGGSKYAAPFVTKVVFTPKSKL